MYDEASLRSIHGGIYNNPVGVVKIRDSALEVFRVKFSDKVCDNSLNFWSTSETVRQLLQTDGFTSQKRRRHTKTDGRIKTWRPSIVSVDSCAIIPVSLL